MCAFWCVCVCVCVLHLFTDAQRAQDGSQEVWLQFPAWPWATLHPLLKFRLSEETVLEESLLRSLIPHPLFTEHLLRRHQALCSGYRLSCDKVLCSGLLLWWTSQGVRCKQIHRAQAGEKSPTGHRPCRMRTSVAKTGLLWEGLRLHSLEKALLSNDFR